MEENKQFQPEYGKEYEFSMDEKSWVERIFACINPIPSEYKYLVMIDACNVSLWKHCRPIRRTLEEKIRDIIPPEGGLRESITNRIMEAIRNHQSEFTDEEILKFLDIEIYGGDDYNIACIRTVRHFTSLKCKG